MCFVRGVQETIRYPHIAQSVIALLLQFQIQLFIVTLICIATTKSKTFSIWASITAISCLHFSLPQTSPHRPCNFKLSWESMRCLRLGARTLNFLLLLHEHPRANLKSIENGEYDRYGIDLSHWFVVWFVSIQDLVYLSGIQVVVQNTTRSYNNRFPCLSIHHPPGRPNAQ